ncbi:hypothetical protein ZWY2020_037204 [Hordeum vulgare]|nr:hypothetical protein ZWY2020_037204 [Hordeum vulgare]
MQERRWRREMKLEEKHAMYEEREQGLRRQQDAQEFLLLLMGTLSETLITKGSALSVKHLSCKLTPEVNGLLEGLALVTDVSITKEHLTSMYDLIALVTHEGPSANAGHYVALVKEDENEWIEFDDAIKTALDKDEVLKFTGGGNFQMAYICLYKARMV